MGEVENLIDSELREIQYHRTQGLKGQIDRDLSEYRKELERQSESRLKEYERSLRQSVESALEKRRAALEKALGKKEDIGDFERIRTGFINGYNDGWSRVSRGENLSPTLILAFLPLGISRENAPKFGLALGCLVGIIENRSFLIFDNPKPYIGAMDMLKKPEYSGYRAFVLEKIKGIKASELDRTQLANYDYFVKKVF